MSETKQPDAAPEAALTKAAAAKALGIKAEYVLSCAERNGAIIVVTIDGIKLSSTDQEALKAYEPRLAPRAKKGAAQEKAQ